MLQFDQAGVGRQHTSLIAPPQDLVDVVEHAFFRYDHAGPTSWRVVPDPSANLVFVVDEKDRTRGAVVGARSKFADVDPRRRRCTFGVRFRPGALGWLARTHAASFTDRSFSVEEVFGAEGRELLRQLEDGVDPVALIASMFDFLRKKRRAGAPERAWWIEHDASVEALARARGLPLRTLHARMREHVGLSPKRVLRILRLYRALRGIRPSASWAGIAADAGFADQSHLVREFASLLGESPTRWVIRADSFKTGSATRG